MAAHSSVMVLSPRRTAGSATPQRQVLAGPTSAAPDLAERYPIIPRERPRGTVSSAAMILEGVLSAVSCLCTWRGATLIVSGVDARERLQMAVRAGTFFALVTPLVMLGVRGGASVLGKNRALLTLGFVTPPTVDEHAVLDLYVMGLAAFAFGVVVPILELLGYGLGLALSGVSALWVFFVSVAAVAVTYVATGACLHRLTPAEGFLMNTRPRKAMWVISGAGHLAIVWFCFYSPDVRGLVGFSLGLVHIVRLVLVAFSVPASCGDTVTGADTGLEDV